MTWRNCSGVSRVAGYGGADAGVVDQDVDPPELRHRGVDEGLAVLRLRDVGGDGDRPPAGRLHRLLGVGQPVDPPRAQRDVGAGLGQRPGEDRAEPRGRPGHDRDPPVEAEHVEDRPVAHPSNVARRLSAR